MVTIKLVLKKHHLTLKNIFSTWYNYKIYTSEQHDRDALECSLYNKQRDLLWTYYVYILCYRDAQLINITEITIWFLQIAAENLKNKCWKL